MNGPHWPETLMPAADFRSGGHASIWTSFSRKCFATRMLGRIGPVRLWSFKIAIWLALIVAYDLALIQLDP